MAYWGFDNTYGRNTVDNDGNKIGKIVRFDKKWDRFIWFLNYNILNGQPEFLSSKQARSIMECYYRHTAYPEDVRLGIYTMSEYVRLLSMDQLWDWYNDKSRW